MRVWKYTINRWVSMVCGNHYHVTVYPDCNIRDVFSVKSGVDHSQKFNTYEEAVRFIKKVRQKLRKNDIRLNLIRKDLTL